MIWVLMVGFLSIDFLLFIIIGTLVNLEKKQFSSLAVIFKQVKELRNDINKVIR